MDRGRPALVFPEPVDSLLDDRRVQWCAGSILGHLIVEGCWLLSSPTNSPSCCISAVDARPGLQHRVISCHKRSMKSLTEHLWFEVPNRRGFVNITGTVEQLVEKSGVKEGICLVNAMHITAAVFINDAEDGLLHDYEVWLEKLAPQ